MFYEKLFYSDSYGNTFPKLVLKRMLTQEAAEWLGRPVSDNEVSKAIFQFSPDKAPGIDRYNAHFFQEHWQIGGNEQRNTKLKTRQRKRRRSTTSKQSPYNQGTQNLTWFSNVPTPTGRSGEIFIEDNTKVTMRTLSQLSRVEF